MNSFSNASSSNLKKRKVKSESVEGSENLSIPTKTIRRKEKSNSVDSNESLGL